MGDSNCHIASVGISVLQYRYSNGCYTCCYYWYWPVKFDFQHHELCKKFSERRALRWGR